MASYSVVIRRDAEAELMAVPFPFRRQINQRIYALKENPRPGNSEVVNGELRVVQVSGWQVLYETDDDRSRLTIVAVLAIE